MNIGLAVPELALASSVSRILQCSLHTCSTERSGLALSRANLTSSKPSQMWLQEKATATIACQALFYQRNVYIIHRVASRNHDVEGVVLTSIIKLGGQSCARARSNCIQGYQLSQKRRCMVQSFTVNFPLAGAELLAPILVSSTRLACSFWLDGPVARLQRHSRIAPYKMSGIMHNGQVIHSLHKKPVKEG